LGIFGQVNHFTGFELFNCVEDYGLSVVVGAFVVASQAHPADILAAFGCVIRGYFVLGEYCLEGALRDAGAAVDAGVWVDIKPWPLFLRDARNDALYGADFHATSVAQAEACNNIRHWIVLLKE
jgi:hypothetical protein